MNRIPVEKSGERATVRRKRRSKQFLGDLLSSTSRPALRMASFSLFGYGSLTFKPPPFPFTSRTGFILNHARRFAQRSHDHRGTPAAYGLVSTLVDAAEWEEYTEDEPIELRPTRCYGTIFTFDDASSDFESEVWRYLDHREKVS